MTSCSRGLKGAASPLVLSPNGSGHSCPEAVGPGRAGRGGAGRAGEASPPRVPARRRAGREGVNAGGGGRGCRRACALSPSIVSAAARSAGERSPGASGAAGGARAAGPRARRERGFARSAGRRRRSPPGPRGPGRRPGRGVLRRHAPAPPPSSSGGRCWAGGLLPAAPGPREPGGGLGRAEPARRASPDREGKHAPGSGRLQPVVWVPSGSSLFPSFSLPLRSPFCPPPPPYARPALPPPLRTGGGSRPAGSRPAGARASMGGKQSTAARSRGPFPGVSTDDSAVPPPGGAPHFGHYRAGGGAMGLRSRSVSSVAGMGMDPSSAGGVSFGLYTPASRGAGDAERAPGSGGSASDSTYAHGNGYQETGGGHHRDGMLYLGSRASLADALPLHIAPRWFSSHSGFKCPICSKSVASDEMEMHFIMCLSKPRLSYNDDVLTKDAGECVICLEELLQGDTIARLPCLCIYHKRDSQGPVPERRLRTLGQS
uniref:RING-type E3 ubiquitin transferase n=1 Tax=Bos mutus grunniens TaxID=30521 RepID=A0A8C0ABV9_BOSMU